MNQRELQYYVQKRREGWDNSKVRKELESEGYSENDIFYFLNEIDDEYVKTINAVFNS